MTETLEHTARRIAERGRDALLARLRPAFKEAASAHSDVLTLDGDQLEQMVQRAADRADGLQWRRALAGVATEELGIGLGEALSHPAVARAQDIVGAPSYEESLAAVGPAPGTKPPASKPSEPTTPAATAPESADEAAEEASEAPPEAPSEEHETSEPEPPEPAAEGPVAAETPVAAPEADGGDGTLRLAAVHLGGIANLEPAEQGIELRLSEAGLDIARGPDELLGRLRWPEIRALEVPPPKGMRRRRRTGGAHLVIRTRHGDATFEIPEASAEELQTQLQPLIQRHSEG